MALQPYALASVADFKDTLNIGGPAKDDVIERCINAASRLIEADLSCRLRYRAPEEIEGAANIVASACCSSMGSMLKAKMLPSTPKVVPTTVEALIAEGGVELVTAVLAGFVSTNAPTFSGTLVLLLAPSVAADVLKRLGV